jgi:RNA polymerase sigma-70 factor (ECF subfamily)
VFPQDPPTDHRAAEDGEAEVGNQSVSSPQEFLKLLLESERRIYAFIVSVLPNLVDAEDVLQETSLILWQKFDQYQPGSDFVAWACRVAQLRVLKFYEKQARSRLRFGSEAMEAILAETIASGPVSDLQHAALATCLAQVEVSDRVLLQRRYSDGASPRQIAEQIGSSIHIVYRTLRRIHRALLVCIQRKIEQEG